MKRIIDQFRSLPRGWRTIVLINGTVGVLCILVGALHFSVGNYIWAFIMMAVVGAANLILAWNTIRKNAS